MGKVGNGFGRDIIDGHPLEALVWLLNKRVSQLLLSGGGGQGESRGVVPGQSASTADGGITLMRKGHVVMLGSVVQTKWVKRGDTVTITYPNSVLDASGPVQVTFTGPRGDPTE